MWGHFSYMSLKICAMLEINWDICGTGPCCSGHGSCLLRGCWRRRISQDPFVTWPGLYEGKKRRGDWGHVSSLEPVQIDSSVDFIMVTIFRNLTLAFCSSISISDKLKNFSNFKTFRHSLTLPVFTAREHGPWTRASYLTSVFTGAVKFTGREHGPWTRPVNTGSVYRPLEILLFFAKYAHKM